MKRIGRIVALGAVLACATAVHAQQCSGGADGGMDATGCQCNAPDDAAQYTTAAPSAATHGDAAQSQPASSASPNGARKHVAMLRTAARAPKPGRR